MEPLEALSPRCLLYATAVAFGIASVSLAVAGCSESECVETLTCGSPIDPPADAGAEATPDAPVDRHSDALVDATAHDSATMDAGPDVPDLGSDGGVDAGHDAPVMDGPAKDSSHDAPSDAAADSHADGAHDAPTEASVPFPENAVAIWNFDDAVGSATAADATGHGHKATLEGTATIVSGGKSGNALSIDGSLGAFADVLGGPIFDDSQSFSVSAWIQFASFDGNYDVLFSADGANVSTFLFQLATVVPTGYDVEFGYPTADVDNTSSYVYSYTDAAPGTLTWYHFAGVYDASVKIVYLYLNGTLQNNAEASPVGSSAPVKAVGDFIIGAGKLNGARTRGAKATYDGVRIYAEALNSGQVETLYELPE
jgi:hypothetical protein